MIRLIIHSFREMKPVLIVAFIAFSMVVVLDLTCELTMWPFIVIWAPVVLISSQLFYSSPHLTDFTLSLSRKALFRCKMTAIFLAVGIGFAVPLLLICGFRFGGVPLELAKTMVLLLAYLFASASVSVAISPELKRLGFETVRDAASAVVKMIGAAIVVIVHAGAAVMIYSTICFSCSDWNRAVGGLMLVCFLAYWRGRAVFLHYEPVAPIVGTAMNVGEPKATLRRPLAPDGSRSSDKELSGLDRSTGPVSQAGDVPTRAILTRSSLQGKEPPRIAGGGLGTTGPKVAGNSGLRKARQWQSDSPGQESSLGIGRCPLESLGISSAWRFPWLIRPRNPQVLRALAVLAILVMEWSIVGALTSGGARVAALPGSMISLAGVCIPNAFVDWGMMVSLVSAAYPRRRLFLVITLIRVSPVLVGSLLAAVFISDSVAALVGTAILAFHCLVFWLSVPPSPRHVCASQIHKLLNRAFAVGWILSIGVWVLADIVKQPLSTRLLEQAWSYFAIGAPVQPVVMWRVSGVCALLAVLLWVHAYKRFKYMEGVPLLSWAGRRRSTSG